MRTASCIDCTAPNSSAAPYAPSGVQRPKINAASPMNPTPPVMLSWNELNCSRVR